MHNDIQGYRKKLSDIEKHQQIWQDTQFLNFNVQDRRKLDNRLLPRR